MYILFWLNFFTFVIFACAHDSVFGRCLDELNNLQWEMSPSQRSAVLLSLLCPPYSALDLSFLNTSFFLATLFFILFAIYLLIYYLLSFLKLYLLYIYIYAFFFFYFIYYIYFIYYTKKLITWFMIELQILSCLSPLYPPWSGFWVSAILSEKLWKCSKVPLKHSHKGVSVSEIPPAELHSLAWI